MKFVKYSFFCVVLFSPFLVKCMPELNRIPETYWQNGRSYRSNFTISILPNKTTTRKPYSTFLIHNAANKTTNKPSNPPSLIDPVDWEMSEISDFKLDLSTTPKVSTTTKPSTSTHATSERTTSTTISDNSSGDFLLLQHFPINVNNFSIKTSQDELDHVEETFTYQVKRQNKNKLVADQDILKKSELLQLLRGDKNQEERTAINNKVDEASKKVDELEIRMGAFLQHLLEVESNVISGHVTTNATIKEMQTKVGMISENYRLNENATQDIRNTFAADKSRFEGQINSLSMHLRNLYNTTGEKILNVSSSVKRLNSSVENISHDIRMNEMKIRFNQKALTTLDKNVQSNNEQILDLTSSVGPKWVEQTTGCGGILIGDAGLLSYKFRQPYLNNERCIWTIRANRRQRVMLQVLEDGFQNTSNSDFITVTEFTEEMTLVTSSRIEQGNRAVHTFRGPLLFVSFFSDSTTHGNGFTLTFHGHGNYSAGDSLNSIRYRHSHWKDPVGHVNHPEEKNALYQPNEISTFVVSPSSSLLRVNIRYTDMEKEENCEYDSVSFYGSVKSSYALAKKYCDQQKSYSGESLQSADGTFIVIFRSDSSTQFKGFQFSW
ncbi:uncharacterized protein LOC110845903 isoform X1 [Folsomia candida]|uniref:uncharacterized protein LOC110845903 isoform X1 n=1 Tax=Folsomia candida TaxID=158441 RepID=UPI000B8FE850|nr:uncharacterized protein LOC110845903 isoform X1 [Folsomia candida]